MTDAEVGCMNNFAVNYESYYNVPCDDCCEIIGCMDENYLEYNPEANIENNADDCDTEIVYGCTDSNAPNYNPSANTEDASCDTDANGVLDNNEVDVSNQYTYVPDNNFENWLRTNGHDDVMDNYVLTDNIDHLTNIDISNQGIDDLTGIEDFVSLDYLYVNGNSLTELDLSNSPDLIYVKCNDNDMRAYSRIVYPHLIIPWQHQIIAYYNSSKHFYI